MKPVQSAFQTMTPSTSQRIRKPTIAFAGLNNPSGQDHVKHIPQNFAGNGNPITQRDTHHLGRLDTFA